MFSFLITIYVAIISFFVTIYFAMIIPVVKLHFADTSFFVNNIFSYFATISFFVTSACFKYNR